MERNTEKLKLASVDLQSKSYTLNKKGKSMLFFPLFWTILFDRCISIQALIIRCYAMSSWRFPKKLGLPVVWTKQPQRKRQQQQQQAIKIRKVKLRHGNAVKLQSYLCRQPSTNSQRISPKLAVVNQLLCLETLMRYQSNKCHGAVVLCGTVYYTVQGGSNSVDETLVCDQSNENYWPVLSCGSLLCCTKWF